MAGFGFVVWLCHCLRYSVANSALVQPSNSLEKQYLK